MKTPPPKPPITGAEALVQGLIAAGITHAFGIPGASVIPLYDALFRHRDAIQFTLCRHEQSATHMADGYARASGRPAAVVVSSGPGATNTITGIMTAFMDSVPLIVLSGQAPSTLLGKDAFQETDVFNLSMPVVKHSYLLRSADDAPRIIREAVHIATTGRPGPVLVDVPRDVALDTCSSPISPPMALPGYHPVPRSYAANAPSTVLNLLAESRRPLLLAGHGTISAAPLLRKFAERTQIPVVTTLLAKGLFPDSHPLALGMPGMHGTPVANLALSRCDFLLCIGSRLDDRILGAPSSFCPNARIVHVDIDPAEFGKTVQSHLHVQGDAAAFLKDILPLAKPAADREWLDELAALRTANPVRLPAVRSGLHAPQVIAALRRMAPADSVVVTDVGQHQMWTAQYFPCEKPRTFITSGGAGTMGFGLPAAVGAQISRPDATVLCIVGDGGFQMTLSELSTVSRLRLPIKIFVVNNHVLGLVRQWQDMFFDDRFNAIDLDGNPDFVKLAKAYGIFAQNLKRPADISRILSRVLAHPGPALVNVECPRDDSVYPMVPPGAALSDMILAPPPPRRGRPPKRGKQTP